ncbi:MATE family efflux transporter [Enterovibrio nigricans]|uniref:Multidrug resistance protein NorM n=1 Tax=Enterovibrio nigricans DSM 22720 TaxID=1121868 RepID=A0A1T4W2J5_9GAMM|nr:MATE family efflux transporter [Enterovibrio nigricans]PKF48979.1 MATE family efflux transporter [Enterovibrio nigricans]SKA71466.1 multidrug resistance protein, MATE family [Enterovibrio nigricans DSM 22720]
MQNYRLEAKAIIKLGIPVFIAQLAQTSMGFVDTVMAGGVSATDMAAVAVASSIWLPSILFGIGILIAMVPIIAQLNGSGRQQKIPFQFQQGAYMALLLSIPICLVLFNAGYIVYYMDVEPALAEKTVGYLHAVLWAVPAYLLFQVLRNLSEGMSLTTPAMIIGFLGLAANIPLNWIFVYGEFGAPALGGVGCGVATAIVYWLMLVAMFIYVMVNKRLSRIKAFSQFSKPDVKALTRLFKMGFPVAAALFFEVTLFAVIALLIAPLGSIVVAAHQIAINFSSMIFMLPMSLATAVSIRVSHQLGAKSTEGAARAAKLGIIIGLIAAFITATLTVIFREPIIHLYNKNPEVVGIAANLMLLAAVYQCTDSIQVVAAGALRGYKDMRAIFERTFIAYWILGVPMGYILGMTDWIVEPMGAYGFWVGIIIGLTSAAIMLGMRLYWIRKQPVEFQLAMAEK